MNWQFRRRAQYLVREIAPTHSIFLWPVCCGLPSEFNMAKGFSISPVKNNWPTSVRSVGDSAQT
jgi:hypothetical protein